MRRIAELYVVAFVVGFSDLSPLWLWKPYLAWLNEHFARSSLIMFMFLVWILAAAWLNALNEQERRTLRQAGA